MSNGDTERIQQIRSEMEALADRWNLQFVYERDVSGKITMHIGTVLLPSAPASAASPTTDRTDPTEGGGA